MLDQWIIYLLLINSIGFLMVGLQKWLKKESISYLQPILALLGGTFGVVLGIACLERKLKKYNLMAYVWVACIGLLQLVVLFRSFFVQKSVHLSSIIELLWGKDRLLIYLLFINVFTFLLYGVDKWKARKQRMRIPNAVLLLFAFLGGSLGGLSAMYVFRHKTQKSYFVIGLPVILCTQIMIFVLFAMG
ncbi:DUF1294 domain-containing protein [Merdibacter massiliensis]|uniref:DUF1294 domain-containing protein n=1 Tax=Merdibacter massiliensis TaxID=1871030 RepID=UPI00192A5E44|nr:DUF1294 domain-containing protein [Merdibacter massiliensis]